MNKLLIYTKQITNRLRYTFELVFNDLLGIDFKIITNFQEFETIDKPKLNYGHEQIKKVPFIKADVLLFERKLKDFVVSHKLKDEVHYIFLTDEEHSDLVYDPFAAIFYMVSRYEEYLPFKSDKFGRFQPEHSIACKHQFLETPVVNLWVQQIKNILQAYYPALKFKKNNCKIQPTFDIDIAFSYRNKGLIRNLGGYFNSLRKFNFKAIGERTAVLSGVAQDPYDTYAYIFKQLRKYDHKSIFFYLVGEYGMVDKNISLEHSNFKNLIKSTADLAHVGLHPSFGSNVDKDIVADEQKSLEEIIKRDITKSRQHYIKVHFPDTYENLIDLEIKEDYSMGYPSRPGFRAGIANPFYFYNLKLEIKTLLKVVPFVMMDVMFKYYQNYTPELALQKTNEIVETVKSVNGSCSYIWHNSSLSETDGWEGWRAVFEEQLKLTANEL